MKSISNKFSYIAISVIFGAIIISFVMTGFQGFNNTAGQVANVDGTPITSREYNQALQFTINRYTQILKTKSLSNQQIRQFRLRESTLQNLIRQKLVLNFARDLNFDAGKKAIKNEIKEYKMFQTADQFDVTKYKQLLQANRLTPTKFEEDIIKQIKSNKLNSLLGTLVDSKASVKKLNHLRNIKMQSYVVSFNKEDMTKFLNVPTAEVSAFAADTKNDGLLRGLYKTYEAEQKAQKKKVGKFENTKNKLARQHLQKTKRKELSAFNEKLTKELEAALKTNNASKLKSLSKKYSLSFEEKFEFSPFNLQYQNSTFKDEQMLNMFKSKDTKTVLTADTATNITLMKARKFETKEAKEEDIKKEVNFSAQKNARLIENAILAYQEKNSKVVTSANLFN